MIRIRLALALLPLLATPLFAEEPQGLAPPQQPGFDASAVPAIDGVPSYPRDRAKRAGVKPPEEPASVGTIAAPAADAVPPVRMERFVSDKGGFAIEHPADWLPIGHPSMALQVRPSLDSLFVLRVQVNKAGKGATAESVAKAQIKRFAKIWQVLGEEATVMARQPAYRIRHSQIIEARLTRAEKVFLVANGRSYMLDCQSNPSGFVEIEPICAHAAKSFSLAP